MPNYADYLGFAPAKLIGVEFFIQAVLFFNFLGIVCRYALIIKSKYFYF